MSETIGTYLLSVAATAVLLSLVQSLLPQGQARRIAGFTGGLLLILCVLSPVSRLDATDLSAALSRIQTQLQMQQSSIQTGNRELLEKIIKQRCETYISDSARRLGLSLIVHVTVGGEDTYPCPIAVTLRGRFTTGQQAALSAQIEADLAIPTEKQEWIPQ